MLQKQIASVDFTQGLDTQSDEKLVVPGKLTRLENSGFSGTNTLSKMGGYSQLSAPLGRAERLHALGTELLMRSSGILYSVSLSNAVAKGPAPTYSAQKRSVIRNQATQSGFDCGYITGSAIEVYAWEDSRGGIRATVRDYTRGTTFLDDTSISTTGTLPRIVTSSTAAYLLYLEGANLKMVTLTGASPTAFSAAVTIATNAALASIQMDALYESAGGVLYLAYRSVANQLEIAKVTTGGGVSATATVAENPTRGLCVAWYSGASRLAVFDHENGAGDLKVRMYNSSLALQSGPTTIDTLVATSAIRQTLSLAPGGTSGRLFYEVNTTPPSVKRADISSTATVTGVAGTFLKSAGLACGQVDAAGADLIGVTIDSDLQPTVFLVRARNESYGPNVEARLVSGVGGGLLTTSRVPTVASVGETPFLVPVSERGRLQFDASANITPVGVSAVEVTPSAALQTLPVNDTLFMCGAAPAVYDGKGVVEAGFHLYPEDVAVTAIPAAGASTAGVYQCVAVYEWTDARGNLWRSAASAPASVTLAANGGIKWTLPTLKFTGKTVARARSEVRIALYRTEANGQVFYRAVAPESSPENDTTVDTISYDEAAVADTSLVSNEPLPFQGGVLDPGPIPPSRTACIHKGRVVLGCLEDADVVTLSTLIRPREGLRFNEAIAKRIDKGLAAAGDVEALASLDDLLIVFREGETYAVPGEPPDDTGNGGSLGEPRIICPDVGCNDFRTLIETPDGLMRMTQKGIYLLGRGQQSLYIGDGVEDFNSTSFNGAVVVRRESQARWYSSAGTVLVYDWIFRQWSTWTNHACVGVVEWLDSIMHATSDGVLHQETGYTHNGTAAEQVVETAWLKLAGLNGFQRVWRALFLGHSYSACSVTVEIAFDYSRVYTETFTFNTEDIVGDWTNGPLQFRHHLAQQKCGAVRFRITESAAAGTGQGIVLTNMSLEVGTKKGAKKLQRAQTV